MLKNALDRIFAVLRGDSGRAVGVLVRGTMIGHLITSLAMPVLTRLYAPDDFAVSQLFASSSAIIIAVACLRYDIAIPIPAERRDGFALLLLSLLSTLFVGLLTAAAVTAFYGVDALASSINPGLLPYLWLLPLAITCGGAYQAMQMWCVREKAFVDVSRSRILQSSTMAAGQIGFGAAGIAPFGLIVGQLLNQGTGFASLFLRARPRQAQRTLKPSWRHIRQMAGAYRRFPAFSVWEALANAASIHLPLLVIGTFAVGPELGYVTLAWFLIQMPMALVGSAIAQVYLSDAAQADREGRLASYTRQIVIGITRAAIVPMVAMAVASPLLFPFIFGPGWERAGWLVAWMTPWCFLQLLASPVSGALHVRQRQQLAMWLQAAGLALRVGAVVLAGFVALDWISEVYAVSGAIFYGLYLWTIHRVVASPSGSPIRADGPPQLDL